MKLNARQISSFLSHPLKDCQGALVYGPDEGQVQEMAAKIASSVVKDTRDPFSVAELSEEALKSNPSALAEELFALNMMGGQRLVRLRGEADSTGKLVMGCYEASPPPAYLLVTAGELPPRSVLRSFFESHPMLAALPCYRDEGQKLGPMISQHFREAGIMVDRETVAYLVENLGNDRGVTRSEIEKIILYCGENKQLSIEDARLLVGGNREITLDDLCYAVASGLANQYDAMLQKHLKEGAQPVQIARALQRYFQKLHLLHSRMKKQKISAEEAINTLSPRAFFREVPLLRQHLTRWPQERLKTVIQRLTLLEQKIKETGSPAPLLVGRSLTEILYIGHNRLL